VPGADDLDEQCGEPVGPLLPGEEKFPQEGHVRGLIRSSFGTAFPKLKV
jgi:hypothetical protein